MVKKDQQVAGMVVEVYKRSSEGGSRRQDRAIKISFLEKQEQLRLDLNLRLGIWRPRTSFSDLG